MIEDSNHNMGCKESMNAVNVTISDNSSAFHKMSDIEKKSVYNSVKNTNLVAYFILYTASCTWF